MVKCPYCDEKHNGTEHFRLLREAKSAPIAKVVVPKPVTTPVINAEPVVSKHLVSKQGVSKQSERVLKWQQENREKYNEGKREYMREWMRRKRGAGSRISE